ncbi:MAG: DUF3786 domain-containing protein [Spirochaetaceae bacterium]|jgi:hypothetical protein|nr:DUF3786 domain-containing protein [Spirochaetaceae bacterium]
MPIKLIYYEGDEEFPAKLQMLYDKTAIQIYNFEQLSVLHVSIVQAIIARGT